MRLPVIIETSCSGDREPKNTPIFVSVSIAIENIIAWKPFTSICNFRASRFEREPRHLFAQDVLIQDELRALNYIRVFET